jgi:hypothetical protein
MSTIGWKPRRSRSAAKFQNSSAASSSPAAAFSASSGAALGVGLQKQPAFVERAAGDAERLALEVGERSNRSIGFDHHGAQRAGIRIKLEILPERALARGPEPVRDNHIDAAAGQGDFAGLGGSEIGDFEIEAGGLVEATGFDDAELPAERAALLRADAEGFSDGGRGE